MGSIHGKKETALRETEKRPPRRVSPPQIPSTTLRIVVVLRPRFLNGGSPHLGVAKLKIEDEDDDEGRGRFVERRYYHSSPLKLFVRYQQE
jgi:hypothetical protein